MSYLPNEMTNLPTDPCHLLKYTSEHIFNLQMCNLDHQLARILFVFGHWIIDHSKPRLGDFHYNFNPKRFTFFNIPPWSYFCVISGTFKGRSQNGIEVHNTDYLCLVFWFWRHPGSAMLCYKSVTKLLYYESYYHSRSRSFQGHYDLWMILI